MKNKLIALSDQEVKWVKEEADHRELTFSDMVRRIIDDRYEVKPMSYHNFNTTVLRIDGTNG